MPCDWNDVTDASGLEQSSFESKGNRGTDGPSQSLAPPSRPPTRNVVARKPRSARIGQAYFRFDAKPSSKVNATGRRADAAPLKMHSKSTPTPPQSRSSFICSAKVSGETVNASPEPPSRGPTR